MNSEYIWIGNKHINSFGSASQFWADYYYRMYREGTKMFYQLKAVMTYKHTGGAGGYYNDPVVAIFKMNYDGSPAYEATKTIKPANNGNMYNGYTYTAESDWFSLDKTSGRINCFISINNSLYWGFDNPDFYFDLGIVPAMATIRVNDGVYYDVDKEENVPNTVPVVLTKPDSTYKTKLKIVMTNIHDEVITIREYEDFDSNVLTFTQEELTKIYNATPDWKMFYFDYYLETFTSAGVSLGVFTDRDVAKVSDTGIKPEFSNFTYSDNNPVTFELTGNRGVLVKGYSNIRMSVGGINEAKGKKGAFIKKYTFVNGEQSKDFVLGEHPAFADIDKIQDRTLIAWAIDSREESTKAEKIATEWVDYSDIEKISFSAERQNGGTSSMVTLRLSGKIWEGNFGAAENSIKSAIYKYKKTTEGEDKWVNGTTELKVTKSSGFYRLEQEIVGDLGATGFDQEESYDIYIEVSDQLSTISDIITLGSGTPAQAIYKNCIALAQPYDEDAGGKVQGVFDIGDIFMTTNPNADPEKRFGGKWQKLENVFLLGASNKYPVGTTGGKETVTLTVAQMPWHQHTAGTQEMSVNTGSGSWTGMRPAGYSSNGDSYVNGTGGGQAHENMPPYKAVFIWERIK